MVVIMCQYKMELLGVLTLLFFHQGHTLPQFSPNLYDEENSEVVYLKQRTTTEAISDEGMLFDDTSELQYEFTAFSSTISLRLHQNKNLLAPAFQIYKHIGNNWTEPVSIPTDHCHYLQYEGGVVAGLSNCNYPNTVSGFVLAGDCILAIHPLVSEPVYSENHGVPHFVQRISSIKNFPDRDLYLNRSTSIQNVKANPEKRATETFTVEIALFFDTAAYKIFSPYFDGNDAKLSSMLLAYINAVQALYHHPSLGGSVDLVLVRMDLLKQQPSDLPHFEGERGKLLDSFCSYNEKHNPVEDNDPKHWDIGLYISGLDFFAYENGRKSGITMGLATVGGVCHSKYSCIIAELGTTNIFGKPYPSAGFTSVYILAHEIGHNLGMHHDSSQNSCPKDGFIMSPSRGTSGETIWSACSAQVISKLSWAKCLQDKPSKIPSGMDHEARFQDEPGQSWGAKQQCEVLLRDHDATVFNPNALKEICQSLKCKTPHRFGFYLAGPALEGTPCDKDKWCHGGECISVEKNKRPVHVITGGWSNWKQDVCTSGCILKSQGFLRKHRTCNNPKPLNTEEGCEGPSFKVELCKDDKICEGKGKKRISVTDYSSAACTKFSKLLPELDEKGSGLQAPYENARLWMGCAIFCRRKDTGSYYTPRLDLNDLGVDPYFPDGTWCHHDGKTNFYCIQHHCLPENFELHKGVYSLFTSEDIPLSQNAPPRLAPLPSDILKYLSLGKDGQPLLTTLKPGSTVPPAEEEWTDHDYIEISTN